MTICLERCSVLLIDIRHYAAGSRIRRCMAPLLQTIFVGVSGKWKWKWEELAGRGLMITVKGMKMAAGAGGRGRGDEAH